MKKRVIFLSVIFVVFVMLFSIILTLIYKIESFFYGEKKIEEVVRSIKDNEKNQLMIINKTSEWINAKMSNTYMGDIIPFWNVPRIPKFPYICIKSENPLEIIFTQCGSCLQYSVLFAKLLKIEGMESLVIKNIGEDHDWNWVKINDSWVNVDVIEPKAFNNPKIYEEGWGKNISYVFYLDENGIEHSVTRNFTDTGNLTINVQKNDKPVENATIIIKSMFLMERNTRYKEPLVSTICITDKNGTCVFELGGNNYLVIAQKDEFFGLYGYKTETNLTLIEGKEERRTLILNEKKLLLSSYDLLSLAGLIVATIGIAVLYSVLIYTLIKKQKNRHKSNSLYY